jgi:large subunit ribosomal protein L17
MRHGKKFNHLGRTKPHREAMLSNMASSLISHKRITTTIAKAKALRVYVEPLITKSKSDSTHSRRMVFRYLKNKFAVAELFRDVAPKVADRPGGYTRIIRTGYRLGDNAEMCIIELVDFNEVISKDTKPGKTRRRRKKSSGSTKPAAETKSVETVEKVIVDETADDVVVEETEVKSVEKKEKAPKAEAKEEPKTEVKAEKKEVTKEEPKAVVKAEKKEEAKAEPKAEAKTEKKTEAKAEPKAEVKTEKKTEAKEKPKTDEKADKNKPKEDNDSEK